MSRQHFWYLSFNIYVDSVSRSIVAGTNNLAVVCSFRVVVFGISRQDPEDVRSKRLRRCPGIPNPVRLVVLINCLINGGFNIKQVSAYYWSVGYKNCLYTSLFSAKMQCIDTKGSDRGIETMVIFFGQFYIYQTILDYIKRKTDLRRTTKRVNL